jgi:hypothetical protein
MIKSFFDFKSNYKGMCPGKGAGTQCMELFFEKGEIEERRYGICGLRIIMGNFYPESLLMQKC